MRRISMFGGAGVGGGPGPKDGGGGGGGPNNNDPSSRPRYRQTSGPPDAPPGQGQHRSGSSGGRHNNNNNNNIIDLDDIEPDDAAAADAAREEEEFYEEEAENQAKAGNIESSAGTTRLNRILQNSSSGTTDGSGGFKSSELFGGPAIEKSVTEKVADVTNMDEVATFAGRVIVPPLKVDHNSIGGHMLDGYPDSLIQETLFVSTCQNFEFTGTDSIAMSALQYPNEYAKHKRSLGMFAVAKTGQRARKLRFVLLARSTNRPLLEESIRRQQAQLLQRHNNNNGNNIMDGNKADDKKTDNDSEQDDYDAMFSPAEVDVDELSSKGLSLGSGDVKPKPLQSQQQQPAAVDGGSAAAEGGGGGSNDPKDPAKKQPVTQQPQVVVLDEEEIGSFPVLVCFTLHSDGTGPDIRKLIPLDQLTTVQDLHSTVLQLAFANGDTIRLDFGGDDSDDHMVQAKVVERPLDKERFVWSLLQVHAMLCMAVVERNSRGTAFLPPLNVRNLDRAELQYVATVNGFLTVDLSLLTLLERQQKIMEQDFGDVDTDKDMDAMAYDLMMGNFATRVTLFHSEEERKDAEEIFNSPEWTALLNMDNMNDNNDEGGEGTSTTAAIDVAERLAFMLHSRMRDLEAETCRRLIAWEDEKHLSLSGRSQLHTETDSRDTVDALALASLFKTLESLDGELESMETWLQERAAAIKPLTDDCADIEEENRQLEQQWKSYEMLGSEMRRLLHGHEIDETTESILKNPAAVLVYSEQGQVDVDESDEGIERIYDAGKALLDAIEFPRKSGGMHLKAVSERAKGHTSISITYCTALAQIIVTVMEQFKADVVAGSDYGKVSKHDTHTQISKKIRDTQRKFQSALLNYIKLIEILAALSPDMLPALRESYAEMVAEGILMKKRLKGYFQALPGKNVAYLNHAGKDLKDYTPGHFTEETVNAPDIRAAIGELFPVVAREAYFVSALFGSASREQDGREKKRNFENAKTAVDKASAHFQYYIKRSCGIVEAIQGEHAPESDPLLCLVSTIYLHEAMDSYIDREKKGGDHSLSLAYVRSTIIDLRKKIDKQWATWVDKQLDWIKSADGVPISGKRAGILSSFARFPVFLDHVLLCCKEGRDESYEPDLSGIRVVNFYMQKMAAALLEILKECASRETTDQAYASNVMLMENTYFFNEAIKQRGKTMTAMFAKQMTRANAICKESTDSYLGWMIKREFAALHELFSRVSKIRKELGDHEVAANVPKSQFVRTLQKEASREVLKEKITTMYSRMEKHLCEEGGLLPVAWKALVKVMYEWFGRWEKLCTAIYRHKLDPGAKDIVRIAKAAGGEAKPKPTSQPGEFGFKTILSLNQSNREEA